jgi:glutamyl-tRNA synthetase
MPEKVRVRIAPSPTGRLHLGTARTALYNWLFRRRHGGEFVLRIEDTDRERSTEEAVRVILDGLSWLGLGWDEGPVFQGERLGLYRARAQELESKGLARRDSLGRDDRGEALVLDCPRRDVSFTDLVKGETTFADVGGLEPHIVLMRSDGTPTYNFACVVDDSDMRITHVIRGDDHVANTWKQLVLYEALGEEPPEFAHLPMIHNAEGRKLSKRDGAVAVTDYREAGFLPEAMVNYLALLGWSPEPALDAEGNRVFRERMPLEELAREFDLSRVRPSPARFDTEKLRAMNYDYIQERLGKDPAGLVEFLKADAAGEGLDPGRFTEDEYRVLIGEAAPRAYTTRELLERTRFFFLDRVEVDAGQKKVRKLFAREETWRALDAAAARLEAVPEGEWRRERIEAELKALADELAEGKLGAVAQPVRVLVAGGPASPAIDVTLELLGRARTLARLRDAENRRRLGG